MSRNREKLISKDGEELDGFSEIEEMCDDENSAPLRPTTRCKRCNCWLRAPRKEDSSSREYCSACEMHRFRYTKPCAACGEAFFSEDKDALRCPECETEYQENKRICTSCGEEFLPYDCAACRKKGLIDSICHACHWRDFHAEKAALRERVCQVCGCRFLPRKCVVEGCGEKLTEICSVCHEEEKHDSMRAEVWAVAECSRCHEVIAALQIRRRKVIVHDLKKLIAGEEVNLEAMAQFSICGGAAPLVFLDRRFLKLAEINALLAVEEEA